MKTFDQLTAAQQEKAVNKEMADLLESIAEGSLRFNDEYELNRDDLQARIDAAFSEMERMQTPWFIGEAILETCRDDIESLARPAAEDAIYLEPGEHCQRVPE